MSWAPMSSKPIQAHVSEQRDAPRARPAPAPWRDWLGVVPFFLFAFLFIVLPSVYLLIGAFRNSAGAFTLKNFADLFTPAILDAYWVTIRISAVTALAGGLLGFMMAYAVTVGGLPNGVRTILSTFSGVAANMGGVVLAFMFISLIGRQGLATKMMKWAGWDLYSGTFDLYKVPGLVTVYTYFQIPLMVLVTLPAIDGLKTSWREASANLGGTTFTYWRRVGLPVLAPSMLGGFLLLFANAYSAFATAYALNTQSNLVPIKISFFLQGDVTGRSPVPFALATWMIMFMAVSMGGYLVLRKRAERWQQSAAA